MLSNFYLHARNFPKGLLSANISCRKPVFKCLWYFIFKIIYILIVKLVAANQFVSCNREKKFSQIKVVA